MGMRGELENNKGKKSEKGNKSAAVLRSEKRAGDKGDYRRFLRFSLGEGIAEREKKRKIIPIIREKRGPPRQNKDSPRRLDRPDLGREVGEHLLGHSVGDVAHWKVERK